MNENGQQTVLIVDDERINRTILADLLQGECRVILAKDGPSALRKVTEEKVALVLLDASMPGMDGYEVLRQLKADENTASVSVIFVTGQTDEEDEERGLSLGAVDYITKPIRPLLVLARVRNHLKLVLQREQLERLSLQDGLTGIANRRSFDQAFLLACRNAARTGEPLGLAMIDVDHFKLYNDRYGHGAGDDALRRVARAFAGVTQRPYDVAARYGGEEFVLLLQSGSDLREVLEQLRANVEALGIAHETSGTAQHLTISCGGVIAGPESAEFPDSILADGDGALYDAKRQGRNCIVVRDMTGGGFRKAGTILAG